MFRIVRSSGFAYTTHFVSHRLRKSVVLAIPKATKDHHKADEWLPQAPFPWFGDVHSLKQLPNLSFIKACVN
jgi:hypothetical protein